MKLSCFIKYAVLFAPVVMLVGCRSQEPIELPEEFSQVYGETVVLETTTFAQENGFSDMTGEAVLDLFGGEAEVEIMPHESAVPEDAVFEAWLIDTDSASDEDEQLGVGLNNPAQDRLLDQAPALLPLGIISEQQDSWSLRTDFPGEFFPYDRVIITIESDGSAEDYDPRPGPVLLEGEIVGDNFPTPQPSPEVNSDENPDENH